MLRNIAAPPERRWFHCRSALRCVSKHGGAPRIARMAVLQRRVAESASEEIADGCRDLSGMRFKREVSGIKEADDRIGNVALERFGTRRQEERIVLTPYSEERRLVGAEVVLESRVERDVTLVVAEQVQLNLIGTGARQIEVVQRLTVRGDCRRVGHAMGILPTRRLGSEEGAKSVAVGLRRLLPIGADRVPAVAQPLFIGVAILRDNRGVAVRMFGGGPEAYRRAIVEDIDCEALQADYFSEAVDDGGDVIECVLEFAPRRHVRLAEARQVGRDDVETIGQKRDQIPEHVARAWEAMQQQQRRRGGGSGFAIKDFHAVYIGRAIFDGGHCISPVSPEQLRETAGLSACLPCHATMSCGPTAETNRAFSFSRSCCAGTRRKGPIESACSTEPVNCSPFIGRKFIWSLLGKSRIVRAPCSRRSRRTHCCIAAHQASDPRQFAIADACY